MCERAAGPGGQPPGSAPLGWWRETRGMACGQRGCIDVVCSVSRVCEWHVLCECEWRVLRELCEKNVCNKKPTTRRGPVWLWVSHVTRRLRLSHSALTGHGSRCRAAAGCRALPCSTVPPLEHGTQTGRVSHRGPVRLSFVAFPASAAAWSLVVRVVGTPPPFFGGSCDGGKILNILGEDAL